MRKLILVIVVIISILLVGGIAWADSTPTPAPFSMELLPVKEPTPTIVPMMNDNTLKEGKITPNPTIEPTPKTKQKIVDRIVTINNTKVLVRNFYLRDEKGHFQLQQQLRYEWDVAGKRWVMDKISKACYENSISDRAFAKGYTDGALQKLQTPKQKKHCVGTWWTWLIPLLGWLLLAALLIALLIALLRGINIIWCGFLNREKKKPDPDMTNADTGDYHGYDKESARVELSCDGTVVRKWKGWADYSFGNGAFRWAKANETVEGKFKVGAKVAFALSRENIGNCPISTKGVTIKDEFHANQLGQLILGSGQLIVSGKKVADLDDALITRVIEGKIVRMDEIIDEIPARSSVNIVYHIHCIPKNGQNNAPADAPAVDGQQIDPRFKLASIEAGWKAEEKKATKTETEVEKTELVIIGVSGTAPSVVPGNSENHQPEAEQEPTPKAESGLKPQKTSKQINNEVASKIRVIADKNNLTFFGLKGFSHALAKEVVAKQLDDAGIIDRLKEEQAASYIRVIANENGLNFHGLVSFSYCLAKEAISSQLDDASIIDRLKEEKERVEAPSGQTQGRLASEEELTNENVIVGTQTT
jgi:formaldehyde-activating enzyme involved in methanogenesis